MVNIPTSLNKLKTKADDLDIVKLKSIPTDLKKLSDAVDNKVAKNTKFNMVNKKVNNLQKNFPDPTILIHINQWNTFL